VIELDQHTQQTIADQRLDAIAQVAAGLSHESRGALQRIGASAEMLEIELEENPTALKHVARIQQSQMHLRRLLDDVQSYASLGMLDRSPVGVSEIWREAWQLLLPQRRARTTELRETIATKNVSIEADRFRLVQVFRNILENSLAACGHPVHIRISCEDAAFAAVPTLRIVVRDNGPGLDAQQRRRIFEPFFTTKPTGTGLGMAIAQRIIEAHGGTIAVGDNLDTGAEIIMELPR
jgi:signal transduction histidine kinase